MGTQNQLVFVRLDHPRKIEATLSNELALSHCLRHFAHAEREERERASVDSTTHKHGDDKGKVMDDSLSLCNVLGVKVLRAEHTQADAINVDDIVVVVALDGATVSDGLSSMATGTCNGVDAVLGMGNLTLPVWCLNTRRWWVPHVVEERNQLRVHPLRIETLEHLDGVG